jgi:hypothetical protein
VLLRRELQMFAGQCAIDILLVVLDDPVGLQPVPLERAQVRQCTSRRFNGRHRSSVFTPPPARHVDIGSLKKIARDRRTSDATGDESNWVASQLIHTGARLLRRTRVPDGRSRCGGQTRQGALALDQKCGRE